MTERNEDKQGQTQDVGSYHGGTPLEFSTNTMTNHPVVQLASDQNWRALWRVSNLLFRSGLARQSGCENEYQTASLVMWGMRFGLDPMHTLQVGYLVHGRIGIYARAAKGLCEAKGVRFTWEESSPPGSWIKVHAEREGFESVDTQFEIEEARKAGLVKKDSNWEKWPQDMIWARGISRAAKRIGSDILEGLSVYEEMRDEVYEVEPMPIPDGGEEVEADMEKILGEPTPPFEADSSSKGKSQEEAQDEEIEAEAVESEEEPLERQPERKSGGKDGKRKGSPTPKPKDPEPEAEEAEEIEDNSEFPEIETPEEGEVDEVLELIERSFGLEKKKIERFFGMTRGKWKEAHRELLGQIWNRLAAGETWESISK